MRALDLKSYIENEHRWIIDCNQADHKPTSRAELDHSTARATELYEAGQRIMEQIGTEDLNRCLRMYNIRNRYDALYLQEGCVLGSRVLVPKYVLDVEYMRQLREAIS